MNLHKPSFGRQHMEAMPPWASCWCIAQHKPGKNTPHDQRTLLSRLLGLPSLGKICGILYCLFSIGNPFSPSLIRDQ